MGRVAIGAILTVAAIVAILLLLSGCVEKSHTPELSGRPKPYFYREEFTGFQLPFSESKFVKVGVIENRGDAGIIKVVMEDIFHGKVKNKEIRYIFLDESEEEEIWWAISGVGRHEIKVEVSPVSILYIKGKNGQDYIPELSRIDVEVKIREKNTSFAPPYRLWIVNNDGSSIKQVAHGNNEKVVPFGIKDDEIFFMQKGDVWILKDGSKKKITEYGNISEACLNPKGSEIVFTTKGKYFNEYIYIVDKDGSNKRRLASGSYPSLSPDGMKIAFIDGLSGDLYLMDITGDNKRILSEKARSRSLIGVVISIGEKFSPLKSISWSPDSESIVFEATGHQIHIVRLDGNQEINLTEGENPLWSPDGSKIAFKRNNKLWLINPDGSNEKQLTTEDVEAFDWSPDGKKIAFISSERDIWIIDHDGENKIQITKGENVYSLSWSFDGKKISFASCPKFKGVSVNINFFDEESKFLLFENINVDVTVHLYTKDKGKLVWSGKSKISSCMETSSLVGERLKIPIEDIEKLKEARIAEVIVHTGRGDFKDEDKV